MRPFNGQSGSEEPRRRACYEVTIARDKNGQPVRSVTERFSILHTYLTDDELGSQQRLASGHDNLLAAFIRIRSEQRAPEAVRLTVYAVPGDLVPEDETLETRMKLIERSRAHYRVIVSEDTGNEIMDSSTDILNATRQRIVMNPTASDAETRPMRAPQELSSHEAIYEAFVYVKVDWLRGDNSGEIGALPRLDANLPPLKVSARSLTDVDYWKDIQIAIINLIPQKYKGELLLFRVMDYIAVLVPIDQAEHIAGIPRNELHRRFNYDELSFHDLSAWGA